MLRLLALSLVLVGTSATAQVYRCKLPSGQMSYSNQPCADQNAGGLVSERRSQEDLMQERERADEAQFRKEMRRAMQEPQAAPTQQRRVGSSEPAVNQWACRKAKDNYQTTAGGTFRNALEKAKTLQEEEQRVNKACGTNQNEYANPQAIADQDRQQKAARRAAIERSMPEDVPIHKEIKHCSGQYCYDNAGQSYHSIGNGQIRSNDGTTCTMSAGKYRCQ
jgi:hypothetical protein